MVRCNASWVIVTQDPLLPSPDPREQMEMTENIIFLQLYWQVVRSVHTYQNLAPYFYFKNGPLFSLALEQW